jgi:drug/metabolite transporter (DMT)-like permease
MRDARTEKLSHDSGDDSRALTGILLKLASVCFLIVMSSLIKASADVPAGEIVFFRSFFAIFPIAAYLGMKGELAGAFRTDNPGGHAVRALVGVTSMGLSFYALTKLPLPEAISIGYGAPILTVVLGALLLGETVRLHRWSAVVVGMAGVLTITIPQLTLFSDPGAASSAAAWGAVAALVSTVFTAFAMIQVRRLVRTERTPTIVIYFSMTAAFLGLLTMPFGWVVPAGRDALFLVLAGFFGGIGQILLTQCYRHANTSTIAPFEYTSMLLSLLIGYFVFGDRPMASTLIGAAIVIAAGIFIIYRERQLGLERARARKVVTPQG